MFAQLKALLGDCGELNITVRAAGDRMKVFVMPPKATKQSEVALSATLPLVGTAEELDAGFVQAITSFRTARKSLADQTEATATILKEAEKNQVKKSVPKSPATKSAGPKVDALVPASSGTGENENADDESEESDDKDASGNAGVTLPASNGSTAPAAAPATSVVDDLASLL